MWNSGASVPPEFVQLVRADCVGVGPIPGVHGRAVHTLEIAPDEGRLVRSHLKAGAARVVPQVVPTLVLPANADWRSCAVTH